MTGRATAEKQAARSPAPSSAAAWEALFGCPAPQRLPSLVERAIAWREQVLLHGDVSPAIAHDLQLAAEHALSRRVAEQQAEPQGAVIPDLSLQAVTGHDSGGEALSNGSASVSMRLPKTAKRGAAPLPPAASQLLPGSRLVKEHGGRNHVVTVEDSGFRYEGELFTSLSAIAKHITGTHWNGLLFFGLRKRRSYPPKPRRHG